MRHRFSLFWGLLLVTPVCAVAQQPPIAFTDVTVVDVEEGRARAGRTVMIRDGRIRRVGPAPDVPVPAGARIVDGEGRFLIPGLWDMHVHAYGYPDQPERIGRISLAYGITGIRDLGSTPEAFERLHAWRLRFDPGEAPRPRIHAAGVIVDGEPPTRPHYITVTNAPEARAALDSLESMGADFVKVYGRLSPEAFRAIVEEATRRGLEFSGHWPLAVGPAAASDAGMTTIEHADDLAFELSAVEAKPVSAYDSPLEYILDRIRAFVHYDERKARPLIDRLVGNGTIVVPTLHTVHSFLHGPSEDVPTEQLNRLLPESQRVEGRGPEAEIVGRDREAFARAYRYLESFIEALHDAGVVIMAGSHAPTHFIPPGLGLHEELERLSEAGLGPAEALRTATLHPARYLGRLDELGTVEEGKLADLVLLDANPLVDIRNTRRVRAVVVDGTLLEPPRLEALLEATDTGGGK